MGSVGHDFLPEQRSARTTDRIAIAPEGHPLRATVGMGSPRSSILAWLSSIFLPYNNSSLPGLF